MYNMFAYFVLIILTGIHSLNAANVICYYESWTAYGEIKPESFDPNLCTHVNYAFIGIQADGNLKPNDENLDIGQGLYYRVTDWKKKNGNLKVLLSVGGANTPTATFAGIASNGDNKNRFMASAIKFISQYHFDGLDIDWEVPGAADKDHFANWLRDIKTEFSKRGWLLTAAVSANPSDGYNVPEIAKHLSFINVMTYDFYGSWSAYTGQNSALYASSKESDWEKTHLNIKACAKNWMDKGAPADKLAIGVAFYGRSFTLADPNQHGIHAPIVKTNEVGVVNYNQICQSYNDWTRVWDDEQKNPYKYRNNKWFGYDDKDSIGIKGDYIKSQNFFGVMVWPIDGDDVLGKCGEAQVLLKNLKNHVR